MNGNESSAIDQSVAERIHFAFVVYFFVFKSFYFVSNHGDLK